MRRLPVYLLLDTSGSMMGEPIESIRSGMQLFVSVLRNNPITLETAYLSVITFDSDAKQLVPLTSITSFELPVINTTSSINADEVTAFGAGLALLCKKIDEEVVNATMETKGDWDPMVFIMTDGVPTDSWHSAAELLKKKRILVVACAAGHDADTSVLQQITESVVQLDTSSEEDFDAFFNWGGTEAI